MRYAYILRTYFKSPNADEPSFTVPLSPNSKRVGTNSEQESPFLRYFGAEISKFAGSFLVTFRMADVALCVPPVIACLARGLLPVE